MSHFIHSCFRINFAGGIEATRISGHCHEAWTRLGLVASRLRIHCQRASVKQWVGATAGRDPTEGPTVESIPPIPSLQKA